MNLHDQHPPIDGKLFRRVMGRFATGVTVITAEAEGGVSEPDMKALAVMPWGWPPA